MKKKAARKQSNALPIPVILIGVGALLMIGVLVWQLVRANTGQSVNVADIRRVSLAEAKDAFDTQSAVFLDVRDSESYNSGHIPGAVNIPLALLENRVSELDPNQWIITYCT